MRLSDQTTVGAALQLFCLATLEKVSKAFPGSEVDTNGMASAKLLIPAATGWDYIYMGFQHDGALVVQHQKEFAPGRPQIILGPFKPDKYVKLSVFFLAEKIVALVRS